MALGNHLHFADDQDQRAKRFREMVPGFSAARDRMLLELCAEQLERDAVALRSAAPMSAPVRGLGEAGPVGVTADR